jgi:excisionase family DNA binding protein
VSPKSAGANGHATPRAGRFVSVKDAAHELGISTDMVRRLIASGDLRAMRIPNGDGDRARRVLIPRAELERRIAAWTEDE